ncbi:MAG: DoxX family protein [Flavobacterium sp. JAD_PAG50586_2]|nr:MAG: DoxX family protein [Flavobacterium sp. JAD_PAG50586_2]
MGILLVRVIIGVLMAFYGYQKLINFETMAASDFWAKEVSFLGMTGKTPLALTIFAEFFCSLLLILGLFTRLALIPLIICMGYIIACVAKFEVIYSGDNGIEVNNAFVYFMIYLGIYLTGPGNYSLDYKIANR